MNQLLEQAKSLLKGAYDLHLHAAPSPFHRALDDFGLLQAAGKAEMAGIVLKSHYESTAARAELVNRHGGSSAQAYGSIALNWPVGGLNPYAVENALIRDAKIVWMPTRDAENSLCCGNMCGDFFDRPGITILDQQHGLKQEIFTIMDIIKRYNAALATGHLSPEESVILCQEGIRRGVRMVLTHPEFDRTAIDAHTQRKLAGQGVWIEKCWYNIAEHNCSAQDMAQHIQEVGMEHCFLTSDRGQSDRELPAEGMLQFLLTLLQAGISYNALYVMTHTVPTQVLGII